MKPVLVVTALALLVLAAGCDPAWKRGAAVRSTLDTQARGARPPAAVAHQADKAHAVLASWQTDSALDLGVWVEDGERELSRALAVSEADDLRVKRSLLLFTNATEMIATAPAPLDADSMTVVEQLLAESRALARVAWSRSPSAVSPANSLKALRQQQTDPSLYDYSDE